MAFRDLDEFLEVVPIELPIGGKVYKFPGTVSAASWIILQRLAADISKGILGGEFDPNKEALTDYDEACMRAEMFGDAQAEMVADGLTGAHLDAVFKALMAFHMFGRATAEARWNDLGESKAPSQEASESK